MKATSRLTLKLIASWLKNGPGYSADISDIGHYQQQTRKPINCPKCRNPIPNITKTLTPEVDRENDITEWKGKCPSCNVPLVVFND